VAPIKKRTASNNSNNNRIGGKGLYTQPVNNLLTSDKTGRSFKMPMRKSDEPRCLIRVPVSFREKVYRQAERMKMTATVYLEQCEVVRNV
jgi:hypothetical protein